MAERATNAELLQQVRAVCHPGALAWFDRACASLGEDRRALMAQLNKGDDERYMLDGFVGYNFTPRTVGRMIAEVGKGGTLELDMNSPGGYVSEGFGIYNKLRKHSNDGGRVIINVIGLAASAAQYITMAADEIRMGEGARQMIHNPLSGIFGDFQDLRDEADVLEEMRNDIASVIATRSGNKVADIRKAMMQTSWYGAEASIDMGFAHRMMEHVEVENTAPTQMTRSTGPLVDPSAGTALTDLAGMRMLLTAVTASTGGA